MQCLEPRRPLQHILLLQYGLWPMTNPSLSATIMGSTYHTICDCNIRSEGDRQQGADPDGLVWVLSVSAL